MMRLNVSNFESQLVKSSEIVAEGYWMLRDFYKLLPEFRSEFGLALSRLGVWLRRARWLKALLIGIALWLILCFFAESYWLCNFQLSGLCQQETPWVDYILNLVGLQNA